MTGGLSCSIVLYHNKPEALAPLLSTLTNCLVIEKIFLVDNSASDYLKCLATGPKTEYIFSGANVGYGAAHNMAIKRILSTGKYHIVLNPDVIFEAGTIENLCNYMGAQPETGLLVPLVKYPDGTLQYACRLLPTPADLIFRRFLPKGWVKNRTHRFEMRESGYNKIMEVPYICGCFMFFRVDALKKAGIFDERFFMYPEDIDITRRVHKYYKTIFYPYAAVTHVHERGSYKSARLLFVHMVNMIKYFNKWGWLFDKERGAVNRKIRAQYVVG